MAAAEVKTLHQKVDQLTDALALIAQNAVENNKNKSSQWQEQEESDGGSESKSESESEEEPSPPPKKKPKQKKKGTAAANKGGESKGKVFRLGSAYKPGMA